MNILKKTVSLFFCAILACTMAVSAQAQRKAYVIELQNQLPETILPTLQPLLGEGDHISALNSELIVTTNEENFANIQELVRKLDTPLRNLMIKVRNDNQSNSSGSSSGFSGGIKQEKIAIDTGRPISDAEGLTVQKDGLAYSTHKTTRTYSTRSSQYVRAVEGRPAYIATGESAPYTTRSIYGPNTQFVDALQGFYVVARVVGERVFLDISASNDRFNDSNPTRYGKTIDTNRLNTTVSGRVGEWISLGGVSLGGNDSNKDIVSRAQTSGKRLGNVSLQVNVAN